MRRHLRAIRRSIWATLTIPDHPQGVPERNALEVVFKAVLALWLLPAALSDELPKSLADSPRWMAVASPWAVVFGAAVSLVGLAQRDREDGISYQQIGLVLVGCGLVIYGAALFVGSPLTQTRFAAGMCFAMFLGCAARWWQLQRYLIAKHRPDRV